jgi:hypothetical protein
MSACTLPPSVTMGPAILGVAVLAGNGITVEVSLPHPRGLHDLPWEEVAARARRLAQAALMAAAESLAAETPAAAPSRG